MDAKKGFIYANFKPETLESLATTTIAYAISQGRHSTQLLKP